MLWWKPTFEEWQARGEALFGADRLMWRFRCPVCGHVASVNDWKTAGAPEGSVGFACVGRWTGGKGTLHQRLPDSPCNYTGGGLFRLNPVHITMPDGKERHAFAFDEPLESVRYRARFVEDESAEGGCSVWVGFAAIAGGEDDEVVFDGRGLLESAVDWLCDRGCPRVVAGGLVNRAVDSDDRVEQLVEWPKGVMA